MSEKICEWEFNEVVEPSLSGYKHFCEVITTCKSGFWYEKKEQHDFKYCPYCGGEIKEKTDEP